MNRPAWLTEPSGSPADVAVSETERIVAWLRLPAIGLVAASYALPPNPKTETVPFLIVMTLYSLWALSVLARVHAAAASRRLALTSVGVDVVAITVLASLSGGPFSQARLAYFLIPAAVAFRFHPGLTASAGAAVVVAYLSQGFAYPGGGPDNEARFILVQTGYLSWFSLASVLGAVLLGRRTQSVVTLAEQRGLLLADALEAEQRQRCRLSEGLHDSAIQNLLSARHAVQEAEIEYDDPTAAKAALARADKTLAATVDELRDAIFELHPYVLEQAGLAAALAAVARRAAKRGGFLLDLDFDDVERTQADSVLLSAAQELLANAATHADPDEVRLRLFHENGMALLHVSDDGCGFEPAILADRLATGHIGLASQRTRVQSLGGSFELCTSPGAGTAITIAIPAETPARTRACAD